MKIKCIDNRNGTLDLTIGKEYKYLSTDEDGWVEIEENDAGILQKYTSCRFEPIKEETMKLSLKELAEKQTRIKLEDGQDKKEFMEWYIAEGGSKAFGRHDISNLLDSYIIFGNVFGYSDEIGWWQSKYSDNKHTTWKNISFKSRILLQEIKWDGKNSLNTEHIRIIKGDKFFSVSYGKENIHQKPADVTIKFGGKKFNHTLDDVNKILALYGYKIVIEEPKYKIKFDGEYTAEEVRKLEELGLKFEKQDVLEEMIKCNADGIVFYPIMSNKVICEYTLEEFKEVKAYPKSNWKMYKLVDGKKEWI